MGNRCLPILAIIFISFSGCHCCWPPLCSYDYGYGSCVDYCGYDCGCGCGSVYDFDQPGGRRWGHGCRRGRMMRQPCPCCGRPMPGGIGGGYESGFDGCFGCDTGCGCGSCGSTFGSCGTGTECGGNVYGGSPSQCSTCQSGMMSGDGWQQSSTQYWDTNTGWTENPPGQFQPTQSAPSSQPMAPTSRDDYYVPSEPPPYGHEPQPTEASGAQFLMPHQQGSAVQPILWAPPGR